MCVYSIIDSGAVCVNSVPDGILQNVFLFQIHSFNKAVSPVGKFIQMKRGCNQLARDDDPLIRFVLR